MRLSDERRDVLRQGELSPELDPFAPAANADGGYRIAP
jgi:hypothetical protein